MSSRRISEMYVFKQTTLNMGISLKQSPGEIPTLLELPGRERALCIIISKSVGDSPSPPSCATSRPSPEH